jgi:hypothetical protein
MGMRVEKNDSVFFLMALIAGAEDCIGDKVFTRVSKSIYQASMIPGTSEAYGPQDWILKDARNALPVQHLAVD